MSNKRLNEDSIVNELKGSSLFFKNEKDDPAAAAEKTRATPPVRAIPDRQDHESHVSAPDHTPTAQYPVQPSTNRIGEAAENPLSPSDSARAPSPIQPEQPVQEFVAESNNPSFGPENNQDVGNYEGVPLISNVRPNESTAVRTPVRIKRTITRYAFEFYQDQLTTLKGLSLEEQLRGERGSMSQMVREALDAYISKRKRTEE